MPLNSEGAILWLSGWSFGDDIFNRLKKQWMIRMPKWRHYGAHYFDADTPERMHATVKETANECHQASGRPFLMVGWSLGGLLALSVVEELEADGLVLLGATARFVRSRDEAGLGWPEAYLRQMNLALKRDRTKTESNFRQTLFTPYEIERGFDGKLPAVGRWADQAMSAGLELLRREDCRPVLPGITCPVLIIHGQADAVCPFGAAEELHKSLQRSKLLAVEDCGHIPFLGREAETADVIRSWWDERKTG